MAAKKDSEFIDNLQFLSVNEIGSIEIDDEIIAKIIGFAAMRCFGVAGMAQKNASDGLISLLNPENMTKGISARLENEGVSADIHIAVTYGSNIPEICRNITSKVVYDIERYTGYELKNLVIHVDKVKIPSGGAKK